MRYLENAHWATTPTVLLPRPWLFKQYEKELHYDYVLHFGKIFLYDSDNQHSHAISSSRRGVYTMDKRNIGRGKEMFQFNQFPICICYSEVDKISIFLKKAKDWWIIWTDFKVNDKEVNYDVFSYHKQKQAREKESLQGREETYEAHEKNR